MPKLFTEEFKDKLEELQKLEVTDRAVEDLYDLLLVKRVITDSDIYEKTKLLFNKKKKLREELKVMADKALEGGEN